MGFRGDWTDFVQLLGSERFWRSVEESQERERVAKGLPPRQVPSPYEEWGNGLKEAGGCLIGFLLFPLWFMLALVVIPLLPFLAFYLLFLFMSDVSVWHGGGGSNAQVHDQGQAARGNGGDARGHRDLPHP